MKKQLLKKLLPFIVITMLFSTTANAQIVYTNIPDTTLSATIAPSNKTFDVDLNNDGISDFQFKSFKNAIHCGNRGSSVTLLDSSAVEVNSSSNTTKLNAGSIINSSATWRIYNGNTLRTYGWNYPACNLQISSGLWTSSSDGYVGVRIQVNNLYYYGWIRISVNVSGANTNSIMIIKDYAYNSIPNQPILAGETSCTTPTVNLTQSGSLSFCAGDSVTLTANGTGYQYQWKKNNVNIAGASSKTYTAKTAGVYKCKVTNSCGSKTSGTRTITIPCKLSNEVFTEQLENSFEIKIAPNPLSYSTTISFSLAQSAKVSLKIFDLNGRLIKTLADNVFEEGEQSLEWNAEKVTPGIYFLKIQSEENLQTEKLIVTK